MWIDGDAVLLVLADVEREESAFNDWYDREHLPDRVVGVPGYRLGRRYVAMHASPKYLALYQCRPEVFETPAYRKLAEHPDARTLHFVPLMTNSIRARTRVSACFGNAEGSVLGLLAFAPTSGTECSHRRLCADTLLPELATASGIIAGALLESFPEQVRASGLPPLRRSERKIEWAVVIESGHAEHIADAVRGLRLRERLAAQSASDVELATYRLTYRISP